MPFAHGMTDSDQRVLRSLRPSGTGPAGFGCTGRQDGLRAEVPKPAADSARGHPPQYSRAFPRAAQIIGEVTDQPQLRVSGDDQPGPAVPGRRGTDLRAGPPELLLEEPERVLQIEPPKKRSPQPVDIGRRTAGRRGPQPDRFGVALTRQPLDSQSDHRPLDDRQLPGMLFPPGAVGQPGVQPVPGLGKRGAIAGGQGRGGHGGLRMARGVSEPELRTVPGRTPVGAGLSW